MFSSEHFIWIGLCAFFIAALLFISLKKSFPLRLAGYIMCGICVVSEISKMMSDLTEGVDGGMVLSPSSLPFHLCSLLLFGVFYVTFAKDTPARQAVIDFMSVAGIVGSICAILIPTNGTDFADIGAYQCFVYHAGLLWFALYLLCSGNARLGRRAFVRNMLFLLALVLLNFYTNSVLSAYGTNFMYLVRPPMENLPFLNLDHGWYVYFLHLVSLGCGIMLFFHLPFILREKRTSAAQKR